MDFMWNVFERSGNIEAYLYCAERRNTARERKSAVFYSGKDKQEKVNGSI